MVSTPKGTPTKMRGSASHTPLSSPNARSGTPVKESFRRRHLEPGSPGYQHAQTLLLLHLPNSQRSFLRIDSVHGLQNDKMLREWQTETQGLVTRDCWFYPFPGDDVDLVSKVGFQSMENQPMRMGLYFLEQLL